MGEIVLTPDNILYILLFIGAIYTVWKFYHSHKNKITEDAKIQSDNENIQQLLIKESAESKARHERLESMFSKFSKDIYDKLQSLGKGMVRIETNEENHYRETSKRLDRIEGICPLWASKQQEESKTNSLKK